MLVLFEIRRGKLFVAILVAEVLSPMRVHHLLLVTKVLTGRIFIATLRIGYARTSIRSGNTFALAASSGLIATYAISQAWGFDPLLLRTSYIIANWNGELVTPAETLGDGVYLGRFPGAAIIIIVGLVGEAKSIRRPILWGVSTLSLLATALSGSYLALLAPGVAALFSLPVLGRIPLRNCCV